MKWYIINVINTKENQVVETIDNEISIHGLERYVSQVISPKEKYFQIRQGKKIKAEKVYFPGYVFIEADINGELIKVVESVNGVKSFLKGSSGPISMTDREVKNLKMKLKEETITDNVSLDKLYTIGTSVTVIDGPFSSFVGNIAKVNNSKKILTVNVSIFNRVTPLELKVEQITINN
jgi:transcriptional antiterminator NusG